MTAKTRVNDPFAAKCITLVCVCVCVWIHTLPRFCYQCTSVVQYHGAAFVTSPIYVLDDYFLLLRLCGYVFVLTSHSFSHTQLSGQNNTLPLSPSPLTNPSFSLLLLLRLWSVRTNSPFLHEENTVQLALLHSLTHWRLVWLRDSDENGPVN